MALQPTKPIKSDVVNGYTLELRLTENSMSVTNNTSEVYWELVLVSGGKAFSTYHVGWSVSLNGTVVSSKTKAASPQVSINKNGSLTVASGTNNVTHNNDGTLNMSVAASIDMDNASYTPGPMSLTGSMTMTTIPRASTLSIANGTLGTAQTLTISRASSSFTHTLTYTCGIASGTIVTKTSNTSVSWTPPVNLAAQNTTGTTVSVTAKLTTYNGSTEVGNKSYTVKMTIPASVKPSVSITTSNPEGHLAKYGGYVQGKSTCQIALSTTTAQGSAIKSYSIKVGTKLTYTTNGCTTSALPEAGNAITVTATVTDARGRSGTASTTIKVLAYSAPQITKISAIRTNSSGTAAADSGTYAKVTFSASVTALGNANAATYVLKYRVHGTSAYSSTTLNTYAGQYSVTNGSKIISAALDKSYDCYIAVTDDFSTVNSMVVQAPSGAVFFRTNAAMNGLSFGKMEVKANTLGLGWDLEMDNPLAVVSGGTGQATSRQTVTFTVDTTIADGSSSSVILRYFPYLRMCFIGAYFNINKSVAKQWYTLGTVPADYYPMRIYALGSSNAFAPGSVRITSAGALQWHPHESITVSSSIDLHVSGWWFVQ